MTDDDEMNRDLLQRHLKKQGYTVTLAENGRKALEILAAQHFDLVLLDMMMPEINGYETLRILKRDAKYHDIPVIMLSALDEIDNVVRCLEEGAEDYLAKPFEPALLYARISSCLKRKRSEEALRESKRRLNDIINFLPDATFVIDSEGKVVEWNRAIEEMTGVKAADILGKGDYEYSIPFYGEKRPILIDLVRMKKKEIETSYSHLRRVGDALIGQGHTSGLKQGELWFEGSAAMLRDSQGNAVGAIEMRKHSVNGANTLQTTREKYPRNSFLNMGIAIARSHHEHWNGNGYPDGLVGEEIPLSARIMAVADVYDALRSKRPYKPAMTHEKALQIIREGRGTQFDPRIVDAFDDIEGELDIV